MKNGRFSSHPAWKKFAQFQVFEDHTPMAGFRLVMQICAAPASLERLVEARAKDCNDPLDPELARLTVRAGLGLVRSGLVSFVYATPEEAVALIRKDVLVGPGSSMGIHDRLVSMFAARFALLAGYEMPARGRIYEFPDLAVVRRAFSTVQEGVEEWTPVRSSSRLGAQLRGRGEAFHPSMVETLEEQTSLLRSNGVDMDTLPSWWWRGVAARARADGRIEVFDDLPAGEEFGALVDDP